MDVQKKVAGSDGEPTSGRMFNADEKVSDFGQRAEDGNVERGLKGRHIQLIAIGQDRCIIDTMVHFY